MTKIDRFTENQDGARELEELLDRIHGADRPNQIAGHYGNGAAPAKRIVELKRAA